MPIILRVKAFKLYFYSHEGPRCHVHIKHSSGVETVVWMDNFTVKKSSGEERIDHACIKLAIKYQDLILSAWDEYFGVEYEEE